MTGIDNDAFLLAIKDRPGDSLTRLIYADWLEQHGGDAEEVARLRHDGNDPEVMDAHNWVAENHKKHYRPDLDLEDFDRPENWTVWSLNYGELLGASNGHAVGEEFAPFTDAESDRCCGAVDEHGQKQPDAVGLDWCRDHGGYYCSWAVRVFGPNREVTDIFKKLVGIEEALDNYYTLDEEDYSRREYEATLENIDFEASFLIRKYDLNVPKDFATQMYSWFSDNDYHSVLESHDDRGGYPSDEDCEDAFIALGWMSDPDKEPVYWDISMEKEYVPDPHRHDQPSLFGRPEPLEESEECTSD